MNKRICSTPHGKILFTCNTFLALTLLPPLPSYSFFHFTGGLSDNVSFNVSSAIRPSPIIPPNTSIRSYVRTTRSGEATGCTADIIIRAPEEG